MSSNALISPAELAAEEAITSIYECIAIGKSFLLEAGAGAGKTYSLIQSLKHLIEKRGVQLLRQHQHVACITYTNVASDEIASRTDGHPVIHSSTIHSFCWSIIQNYQPYLRSELPNIHNWSDRLAESGGTGNRKIRYDEFGHRTIEESYLSLHHDDVLALTIKLLEHSKFRKLLTARYPILLIDEYQDTDKGLATALITHCLGASEGPLLGLFGDHWQKIYGSGCGKIDHPNLKVIGKQSNFRSAPVIVQCLNRMRPELTQYFKDPNAEGSVAIYHTNDWMGQRRTGQHWSGDVPADIAHRCLSALQQQLTNNGWDFTPDKTKILLLTHNILAAEQGYHNLAQVFPHNEAFIKKEDPHIAFFVDTLEPLCAAYKEKLFGDMFALLGGRTPSIRSHKDKVEWSKNMDTLLALRDTATIGSVLDHLKRTKRPRLPDAVESKELELEQLGQSQNGDGSEPTEPIERLRKLRDVSYQEVIALGRFISEKTPFATKHGVKGAEFENVLVVVGRGWNQYNFNQFLEWAGAKDKIPPDKMDAFERNRNLFYVTCSRPKKRLAVLFTQKLTDQAMTTLANWFGDEVIHSLGIPS